jgi:hypothetical protein
MRPSYRIPPSPARSKVSRLGDRKALEISSAFFIAEEFASGGAGW